MNIPADLRYTKNDEWVRVEGNTGTIGISDYAQDQLSDIVYVEVIIAEGDMIKKGDPCATIESVKAAADVYSPVSGKVIEINEVLPDTPEKVNGDPYGEAWMMKVEISDLNELKELLDAAGYQKVIAEKE